MLFFTLSEYIKALLIGRVCYRKDSTPMTYMWPSKIPVAERHIGVRTFKYSFTAYGWGNLEPNVHCQARAPALKHWRSPSRALMKSPRRALGRHTRSVNCPREPSPGKQAFVGNRTGGLNDQLTCNTKKTSSDREATNPGMHLTFSV